MNVQPAPMWDYLRSALKGHRTSGTVDHRVGAALDDLARCVSTGEVTLAEGLVLGNAVVAFAGRCSPLPDARHEPRDPGR